MMGVAKNRAPSGHEPNAVVLGRSKYSHVPVFREERQGDSSSTNLNQVSYSEKKKKKIRLTTNTIPNKNNLTISTLQRVP
jgi:hypothetical protein